MLKEILENKSDLKFLNSLKKDMGGQMRAPARTLKDGNSQVVLFVDEGGGNMTSSLVIKQFNGRWSLTSWSGYDGEIPDEGAKFDLGPDLNFINPDRLRKIIRANTGFSRWKKK